MYSTVIYYTLLYSRELVDWNTIILEHPISEKIKHLKYTIVEHNIDI